MTEFRSDLGTQTLTVIPLLRNSMKQGKYVYNVKKFSINTMLYDIINYQIK